jgi:heme oxygenase (biliverdin-IX-beta and delta-forming)
MTSEQQVSQQGPHLRVLRESTRSLHLAVEEAADLPASVRSASDYADLMRGYWSAHAVVHDGLAAPELRAEWVALGIDVDAHDRRSELRADLLALGLTTVRSPAAQRPTIAQAVGQLYVVEGSAIGGRFIARGLTERLPGLPMAFLAGTNRAAAWRAVRTAIERLPGSALPELVDGATAAFTLFLQHVSTAARRDAVYA